MSSDAIDATGPCVSGKEEVNTLDTPSTRSQCDEILRALETGRGITPADALAEFRCFRLAARVHDLRRSGHNIVTMPIKAQGKRWAMYFLLGGRG